MFANLASLQEVTLGDGVTAIGDRAFAGTSLARVDPVSYTHLDVYKRQGLHRAVPIPKGT